MGEGKDITDSIYESLMARLDDMGYEKISRTANNLIVDLIDVGSDIEELLPKAIEIIENNN